MSRVFSTGRCGDIDRHFFWPREEVNAVRILLKIQERYLPCCGTRESRPVAYHLPGTW
jgi:hypothetical protein